MLKRELPQWRCGLCLRVREFPPTSLPLHLRRGEGKQEKEGDLSDLCVISALLRRLRRVARWLLLQRGRTG